MISVNNFKLAIGIPCSWTHVPTPFFDSFIQMEKPNFIYCPAKNGPIDGLRNNIVEQALKASASHLLMMDTDQIYPIDTITKLLSHKLSVVHCPVPRRYEPFDNILLRGKLNKYTSLEEGKDYKDGELISISATGTGCVLYSMEVFYKIKPPWFQFLPNRKKSVGGLVGEDIGFCIKLKKAGFKIYADTSIKMGHLTTFVVDENFARLYKSLCKRQEELYKAKNNSLGG